MLSKRADDLCPPVGQMLWLLFLGATLFFFMMNSFHKRLQVQHGVVSLDTVGGALVFVNLRQIGLPTYVGVQVLRASPLVCNSDNALTSTGLSVVERVYVRDGPVVTPLSIGVLIIEVV